jgi:uncharacterized membrane protein YhaH (DUF805 family)
MSYYLRAFRRYVDFRGRATRTEYWLFLPFHVLVYVGLVALASWNERLVALVSIYFLGSAVPLLALVVRRLHDQDKAAWWLLLGLVPFGSLVVLVFMTLPGTPGANRHGADPRLPAEEPRVGPWPDEGQEPRW